MKKAINILVSIVFLISFIGVQVHKHYSHGELYSVAVYAEAENCCEDMETCDMTNMSASCEHQKQDDCSCKDETETFKLNANFVVSEKQEIAEMPVLDVFIMTSSFIKIYTYDLYINIPFIDISPPRKSLDIQAEFGVFLC